MPVPAVSRRPLGFAVLAIFAAWYAAGALWLAVQYLRPAHRALPVVATALAVAVTGAAAALALWTRRSWAARAVAAWGAAVVATFAALFVALPPLPDGTRPWSALATGAVLFAAITWGLVRYVASRTTR